MLFNYRLETCRFLIINKSSSLAKFVHAEVSYKRTSKSIFISHLISFSNLYCVGKLVFAIFPRFEYGKLSFKISKITFNTKNDFLFQVHTNSLSCNRNILASALDCLGK